MRRSRGFAVTLAFHLSWMPACEVVDRERLERQRNEDVLKPAPRYGEGTRVSFRSGESRIGLLSIVLLLMHCNRYLALHYCSEPPLAVVLIPVTLVLLPDD